jgi:hypothetical protein
LVQAIAGCWRQADAMRDGLARHESRVTGDSNRRREFSVDPFSRRVGGALCGVLGVRKWARSGELGTACHARAFRPEETDWDELVTLYTALARTTSSPIVELNRAVAVSWASGPADALALADLLGVHVH